jgi:hypothetical protein
MVPDLCSRHLQVTLAAILCKIVKFTISWVMPRLDLCGGRLPCAVATSKVGPEVTLAAIAIAIAPFILEARKSLRKDGTPEEAEEEFNPIPFL